MMGSAAAAGKPPSSWTALRPPPQKKVGTDSCDYSRLLNDCSRNGWQRRRFAGKRLFKGYFLPAASVIRMSMTCHNFLNYKKEYV
jgi:hypothetical protein